MKKIVCYFDGSCEPTNPGGAMCTGSIVKINGEKVWQDSKFYPAAKNNTNNISEYTAFGLVLKYLIDNNLTGEDVTIMGDSQLVINQMNGQWAIKEGAYRKYAIRCRELLSKFNKKPTIFWIKREQNVEADELSKSTLAKNNIEIKTHSDDPTVILFGKYKGKSINDIEDAAYLEWAILNVKMKPFLRNLIKEKIQKIRYEAI